MNKNNMDEDLEGYLNGPPIDETTARNLLAAQDAEQAQQDNLGRIKYSGYMGAQTKTQAAVPLIPQAPSGSAIKAPPPVPSAPRPRVYQRFSADAREDFLGTIRAGLNAPPNPAQALESLTKTVQAAKEQPVPETKEGMFQREVLGKRFRFDPDYNAPPSILRMNGERFGILEGISLIGGKQKSGKTQLISAMAAAYLTGTEICGCQGFAPPERPELIWIDTEQSVADLHMVLKRAELTCNERERENLFLYHLRDYRGAELIYAVRAIIQAHPRASLILLDHIGDACDNPNDIGPVKKLVHDLHGMAKEFRVHLLLTMHMNKHTTHQGNNANSGAGFEGWLGKEIQKKAETTACVFKDKDSDLRVVECTDARGKDFNSFRFRITAQDELPQKLEQSLAPGAKPGQRSSLTLQPFEIANETHLESIHQVFSDGRPLTYQEMVTRLKTELTARTGKTCTDALARAYKEHWTMQNLVTMEGTPNTRSCRYTPADSGWERKPLMVVPSGNDLDKEAAALFPGMQPELVELKPKRKRKRS